MIFRSFNTHSRMGRRGTGNVGGHRAFSRYRLNSVPWLCGQEITSVTTAVTYQITGSWATTKMASNCQSGQEIELDSNDAPEGN